jgi:dTDP-4-dehydrorhamnose 3,5-epimerase
MFFEELELEGAYLIKPEPHIDERGFFARSFCKKEFQKLQLVDEYVQCNISYNKKKGTLRGMHYQLTPHEETKLVRCTKGSVYDVIVDIRKNSITFGRWIGVSLNENNRYMLYVPKGFAHGFITEEDNTEVFYQMSCDYVPKASSGFVWNDKLINIQWPQKQPIISSKDCQLPVFFK